MKWLHSGELGTTLFLKCYCRKRDAAYYAGLDYHRAGESSLAHAQFVKSVDIDPYLCYLLIEELRKLGIQFVVAPYEADAQLAYLCRTGVVDAVITEDSDLIAYGCPRVLFKLDKNGDAREWRRRWLGSTAESFKAGATSVKDTAMLQNESTVQLERLHQYDDDLLVLMCVLAGCDYCPSLPGVGIKKANGIINTYKKNWRLVRIPPPSFYIIQLYSFIDIVYRYYRCSNNYRCA